MKIKELYDSKVLTNNFFYNLIDRGFETFPYTENDAKLFDLEYYKIFSSEKNVQKSVEELKSNLIEIYNIIYLKFGENWKRIYNSFFSDYNPIENYSMKEIETPNLVDLVESKANSKIESSNSSGLYGFGDENPTPISESNSSSQSNESNNFRTDKTTKSGSRSLTRSGNIGVTTSQQMIESEFELRKHNFMNIVFNDIDSVLASKYFN